MGSSDRQRILDHIRRVKLTPVELPSLDQAWITYDDSLDQFVKAVESVAGVVHVVSSYQEARERLESIPTYQAALTVFSQVPELAEGTIQTDGVADPHDLAHVDYGVFLGNFGVAENGAIWLTDEQLDHRVLFFIAQHVVLVMSADQIVNNMHEAYQRISFPNRAFGVFMSGPSKTADIEQSLVIGAHGARSLVVLLIRST